MGSQAFTVTQLGVRYLLTTAVSPPGAGTISVSPASSDGTYAPGSSVQLTAVPAAGYQFIGWTGDVTGSTNPQSLIMSAARSVTGVFGGMCTYGLSAGETRVGTAGGGGSFGVAAPVGCAWSASSPVAWITITGGASGSGNGTVTYTVQANPGPARSATLIAAGQPFTITQTDGCVFGLTPAAAFPGASGGPGQFAVGAPSNSCAWSASSSASWLTITGGGSGTGSGSVSYAVAQNPSATSRSATVSINGQTLTQIFTVVQGGACSYSLQQASQGFVAGGGSGAATVLAPGGCAWSAASNASWVTVMPGAGGSGNGNTSYTVAANSGPSRTGTLTIAGITYTITQAGAASPPASCTASAPAAARVALEGRTEVAGELDLFCTGFPAADFTLRLDTNVTNALGQDGSTIDAALTVNGGSTISGRISGYNAVRWPGVALPPAGGTVRITNVRVDASQLSLSASLQSASITGQVSVTATSPVPVNNATQVLATAAPSLAFQTDPATSVGSQTTIPLHYREATSASFQSGTRLRLVVNNVPGTTQVYAPIFPLEGSTKAQLYSGDANGLGGSPVAGSPMSGVLYQQLFPIGGTVTATWVVLSADPTQQETLTFPLLIINASPADLNQIQVAGSVGPISTVGVASTSAPVPRYRDFSVPQRLVNLRMSTSVRVPGGTPASMAPGVSAPNGAGAGGGTNVTLVSSVVNDTSDPTQTATNVVVQDNLPTGLILVSCSGSGGVNCSGSGGQLQVNFGSLGSGQSATVTVVAEVDPSLASGTILENPVNASSDEVNADLLASSASANIIVIGPVAVGGTPAFGTGGTQSFTFQFSDQSGYQALGVVNVLINNVLDGRNACYLAYSVNSNRLFLVDDAGDAGGPFAGSLALGDPSTIQNSQCAVNLTSAVGSGNTLTLVMNIVFKPAFGGNRIVYVAARDQVSGNTNWQALGVWQAPFTPAGTMAVTGAAPARGAGAAGTNRQYAFTFTDAKGTGDFGIVNVLINSSIDGRKACYVAYNVQTSQLFLVDDQGDAGGPFAGGIVLNGGSTAVQNSQCSISGVGSSAAFTAANTLTLTLNITFLPAFTGNQVFFAAARDVGGGNNTGWLALGTWTVQ